MRKILICAAALALAPITFTAAPANACDECQGEGTSAGGGDGGGGGGRLDSMFSAADADESGELSFDEFAASRTALRQRIEAGTGCQHVGTEECDCAGRGGENRPADTDEDGEVSDAERAAHLVVRFAEIDADGDENLTIDELRTARRARRGFTENEPNVEVTP